LLKLGIDIGECSVSHAFVTWSDTRNDVNKDLVCDSNEGTCMDIYGQYVSTSGLVMGGEFAIAKPADSICTLQPVLPPTTNPAAKLCAATS
jgi:hypothetical protein